MEPGLNDIRRICIFLFVTKNEGLIFARKSELFIIFINQPVQTILRNFIKLWSERLNMRIQTSQNFFARGINKSVFAIFTNLCCSGCIVSADKFIIKRNQRPTGKIYISIFISTTGLYFGFLVANFQILILTGNDHLSFRGNNSFQTVLYHFG